jgi:5-(carboxyamino)imidazole ribonucleotide synthase
MNFLNKKIGVLGGGQLGRMLQEKALQYGVNLYFLDPDKECPCSIFSEYYTQGSFKNYEDVIAFGKDKDCITIEIEHVNIEALEYLENQGVEIVPNTRSIKMIQNKALQKQFYQDKNIPSSPFQIIENEKIENVDASLYPFFQKSQKDGYDGKGVQYIADVNDLNKQLGVSSILEKAVDIQKELAITVAVDFHKNIRLFPICEMVFDEKLNLVDYLLVPASISKEEENTINQIAKDFINAIDSKGLFSIEFFLTKNNEILVNEAAPRAHNSAHYTMEACNISQFEAQLQILLDLKLPEIILKSKASMVNIIGEVMYCGKPLIEGQDLFQIIPDFHFHLYGKKETKPGRKMGHITLLHQDLEQLKLNTEKVKSSFKLKGETYIG